MWYESELAKYANETRAALSLFLPLPDGMTAREFDQAARSHRLSGIGRAWENTLLSSCRLLVVSVPSGDFADTLRHARRVVRDSDGLGCNALDWLDPTLAVERLDYIRNDRARRALRRAFSLPPYASGEKARRDGGAMPQRHRPAFCHVRS